MKEGRQAIKGKQLTPEFTLCRKIHLRSVPISLDARNSMQATSRAEMPQKLVSGETEVLDKFVI